ncbi:MAG TPA: CDP-alcohol phosphatidyltransferase family protein [Bavariicoccus seileri]|uniref:CDP-diacylglycerol--glycerol-3-phosphate 3-phosphatidyltransferase n=1 Tax=Bavariicoccus seileri TaxID=549685 RepID=A0A3D4S5G8_9ENTE|nr:CDP-alcohol phosphatidyltransferase family protein [Bavariicoccus seileri]HCS93848.1 CDP-alcohol phosphatidyltransferase family protein [Bavariicoccus seileri]
MIEEETKSAVITIPNILSVFRLLLIPVIIYYYVGVADYVVAGVMLIISGVTDLVDGWVARRFKSVSDVGKVLDPVADKLTQLAILFCLMIDYPIMVILFGLLIVKEALLAITGFIVVHRIRDVSGAKWHGKLSTLMLYSVMIIHVLWRAIPAGLSTALVIATIVVTTFSLILYLNDFFETIKRTRNVEL